MSMFRFWSSESTGGEQQCLKIDRPMLHDFGAPLYPLAPTISTSQTGCRAARPPVKRARDEDLAVAAHAIAPSPKRVKQALSDEAPKTIPQPDPAAAPAASSSERVSASHTSDERLDRARDTIQFHFGLEILHKHDELRLIDQELAKCQVALEQLRRCHLIPYPINCPTPDQMLEISAGKGPALRKPGKEVPRWAAPFGVMDGPYARHYAKWLIPDPMFDGMLPPWQSPYGTRNAKTVPEGRTTRNSVGDVSLSTKQRPVRGNAGQKLQSLTGGYPAAKDKNGPCVLRRQSDGQTVKLVCLDCQRENFLSIQGFINHCRIAHRRDFKSHEEAAIHSGQPVDTNPAKTPTAATPTVAEKKQVPTPAPTPVSAQPSGLVHPYAQAAVSSQDPFSMLQSRIQESLRLYNQGKMPGVTHIPGAPKAKAKPSGPSLVSSSDTPFLSRFMQSKNLGGNLQNLVEDAKTKIDLDDMSVPDDTDEAETPRIEAPPGLRMPAHAAMTPLQHTASTRLAIDKPRTPDISFAEPPTKKHGNNGVVFIRDDDAEECDLSPNPASSNNAPSLVSDDGEYSESDDGSSESDAGDGLDAESVSDVGELAMDEDGDGPRSLRHHGESGGPTPVRLRKENKEVTLVSPVKNSNQRRKPKKL